MENVCCTFTLEFAVLKKVLVQLSVFCGCFRIVYCDETGEESSNVNVHQPTTFAHKNLQMEGITVFWDEFSDVSRAGCKSSPTPTVGVESPRNLSITEFYV